MANKLDSERKRLKLKPQTWPHWVTVKRGKSLGFYKNQEGNSWRARMRNEDGKYIFKALGDENDLTYDQALDLANEWFDTAFTQKNSRYTVKNAVDDYIQELENMGKLRSASDTHGRLYKHLIPTLGKKELASITSTQLTTFRNAMVKKSDDPEAVRKSRDTANRIMNMVKAAFNLAYRNEHITSDGAWKKVKSFAGVGRARILFLTDKEVSTLLEHTSEQFKNLVKAAILTGARYGELADAKVRDYSEHDRTVHLTGKTGSRTTFLSVSGAELFTAQVNDKKPNDLIFTKDDGAHWGKNHHSRLLKSAVENSGLPEETLFYSFRHYHISKALLAGIPMQVIAENTGTSIRMIEKHYGKFINSDRQKMFDSVDVAVTVT